jgi:hypothetical protein
MLISTALLLDSIIRNSVCTPAKLPCRRVEVGYEIIKPRLQSEIKLFTKNHRRDLNFFLTLPYPVLEHVIFTYYFYMRTYLLHNS